MASESARIAKRASNHACQIGVTLATVSAALSPYKYRFIPKVVGPPGNTFKKQITIRLDEEAITYFKDVSEQVGIPYQSLINLYLRDCAASQRKLDLIWK